MSQQGRPGEWSIRSQAGARAWSAGSQVKPGEWSMGSQAGPVRISGPGGWSRGSQAGPGDVLQVLQLDLGGSQGISGSHEGSGGRNIGSQTGFVGWVVGSQAGPSSRAGSAEKSGQQTNSPG